MPSISIICGVLLTLIGVVGYGYGMSNGTASPTALIPAGFGIVLTAFGIVARSKENLRKHLMHGAIFVALLGFIATAVRAAPKLAEVTSSPAVMAQVAMAVVCLVFIVLAVKSFIDARKSRAE
jgi:hypothetical protein